MTTMTTTKTMLQLQLEADELRELRKTKMPPLPPLVHAHQLASGDQRSDEGGLVQAQRVDELKQVAPQRR